MDQSWFVLGNQGRVEEQAYKRETAIALSLKWQLNGIGIVAVMTGTEPETAGSMAQNMMAEVSGLSLTDRTCVNTLCPEGAQAPGDPQSEVSSEGRRDGRGQKVLFEHGKCDLICIYKKIKSATKQNN